MAGQASHGAHFSTVTSSNGPQRLRERPPVLTGDVVSGGAVARYLIASGAVLLLSAIFNGLMLAAISNKQNLVGRLKSSKELVKVPGTCKRAFVQDKKTIVIGGRFLPPPDELL